MDLSTTYLGHELPHPFMPGSSVMSEDLGKIHRLEDAGASAIVLHSLFEEQIVREQVATASAMEIASESYAEALSYFPTPEAFRIGPEEYLEHVRKVKESVSVPVFASLNGYSLGGWLNHARLLQDAGADGLELNIYYVATDLDESGAAILARTLELVKAVKAEISIPVAVKLSPFYTTAAYFARQLDEAGVDGEVVRSLHLSDSAELLLRLHWLAILAGRVQMSLAVTGGVHSAADAIKAVMCGAHAVQMVSALLKYGPSHLATIRVQVDQWLEEHEYTSLRQMQGSMSLLRCPDPKAYERGNYMYMLRSWGS
ncbi:MAG: dihydroorotate dehydrogenase-like protein [Armatimonadetes bacterium]|nr:dihydroorotate dehydrogenase-like protein [Armatimonadota bacterium]